MSSVQTMLPSEDRHRDFGGLRSGRPSRVCVIGNAEQALAAIQAAIAEGAKVSLRGLGHSCNGQSVSDEGVLLDLAQLGGIENIGEGYCDVLSGTTWAEVIEATLATGQVPPVLPDYLGLTVGGTISIGGLGGTSFRAGTICDHVLEMQVITADAQVLRCAQDENKGLFDLVCGGAGQFALMTRVRLRLEPAPAQVDYVRVMYPTSKALIEDQAMLQQVQGLWHLGGWLIPLPTGWAPCLELAVSVSAPGDFRLANANMAARLPPGRQGDGQVPEPTRMDLRAFIERFDRQPGFPCSRGADGHAHPWLTAFLPAAGAEQYLTELVHSLPPEGVGPAGVIEVYPVRSANRPEDRDGGATYMISAFPCQLDTSDAALEQSTLRNRRLAALAVELGGCDDPCGSALFFTPDDWRRRNLRECGGVDRPGLFRQLEGLEQSGRQKN